MKGYSTTISSVLVLITLLAAFLNGCSVPRNINNNKENTESESKVSENKEPLSPQNEQVNGGGSGNRTEDIIAYLGCDYEFIENAKSVKQVMQKYEELLEQGKKDGFTPVLMVPSVTLLEWFSYNTSESNNRESILKRAKDIDAKTFLDDKFKEALPGGEENNDIFGEYGVGSPINEFGTLFDYETGRLARTIIVAKLPTDQPWEAAAWIPMGGFNECPMPEEQVAVFKYWYDKYGAYPAAVGYDTWELYLEKPVKAETDAKTLAEEHFSFCGDIVWQGTGTINALAGVLKDSAVWQFWWD